MVLTANELKQGRDIDAEILQGIEEMRSGIAAVVHHVQIPDVVAARQKNRFNTVFFCRSFRCIYKNFARVGAREKNTEQSSAIVDQNRD